jgi:hypothetical protein
MGVYWWLRTVRVLLKMEFINVLKMITMTRTKTTTAVCLFTFVNTANLFTISWSTERQNGSFQDRLFFRKLVIRHWWQSPLLLLVNSQNVLKKLKIGSAASNGGQGKLAHCTQFPWSPLEAGLSFSTCCLYKWGRKLMFLFTRCLWSFDLQQLTQQLGLVNKV